MGIEKPIFILGSGRSGTTVFYNLLSTHPDVCWFSNYSSVFYKNKYVPLLHRMLDVPFVGPAAKKGIITNKKYYIKPSEAGTIYHDYCGFKHSIKTTEMDLNLESEAKLKDQIKRHLSLSGKSRFINKQTANTQRIRLIDTMFKDAYYIHIIRDGRAVANSLLNVSWWNDVDIWWLDGAKASAWEKEGKPAIELCGLHWKRDVEEILNHKYLFEDRYLEIRYETLISNVPGTMEEITAFCELSAPDPFLAQLPQTLPNMNEKWKFDLSDEQKDALHNAIGPFLGQLGYRD